MRAIVVYESMFGNTHEVAKRIADGLRTSFDVGVLSVADAIVAGGPPADLVVVGGPTHVHGMSRSSTRSSAADQAARDPELDLEPGSTDAGLRDWFHDLPRHHQGRAAAFDTRVSGPELLTGRASKGIAKQLAKHGFDLVGEPESFLVDKYHHLLAGEADRAEEWGAALAAAVTVTSRA